MNDPEYDLFLCHTGADKDWVRELGTRLEAESIDGTCAEPRLKFSGNRFGPNPKRGVTDFGPLDFVGNERTVRVGVIGTPKSVDQFDVYMANFVGIIEPGLNSKGSAFDPLVAPDFPGFNVGASFRAALQIDPQHKKIIPERFFEQDLKISSASERIRAIVDRIGKQLDVLADMDPEPAVVAVVLPPEVQDLCQHVGDEMRRRKAPPSTVTEKFNKKMDQEEKKTGQGHFDFDFDADHEEPESTGYWNFHNALKARAMRSGITSQLIWERSIREDGGTQDPASKAWNLATGLYYKAGHVPWDVEGLPADTCFLGISFFKAGLAANADTHASLAQIFSNKGDGLVLKGGKAIKKGWKPPYMDKDTAQRLVKDALDLFANHHPGGKVSRLVVHKTSPFTEEEIAGITAALPNETLLDLVSIRSRSELRFMRAGENPPLRGTCIRLSDRETAMFTVGYVPEFRMYPGFRIPQPIVITQHRGDSTTETICNEVMALTKLNWNSCGYASKGPITTLFAESVGSIMAEYMAIPETLRGTLQTKYRFYM